MNNSPDTTPTLEECIQSLEIWLEAKPDDGFATNEDSINCTAYESGRMLELDFDMESLQCQKHDEWIKAIKACKRIKG